MCREYGGSLRRVRCQANGLAYASTLRWMQVEPQQRNAHPSEEDRSGSMNLPTSVEERVKDSSSRTCRPHTTYSRQQEDEQPRQGLLSHQPPPFVVKPLDSDTGRLWSRREAIDLWVGREIVVKRITLQEGNRENVSRPKPPTFAACVCHPLMMCVGSPVAGASVPEFCHTCPA